MASVDCSGYVQFGQSIPVKVVVNWQATQSLATQMSVTDVLTLHLIDLLSTSVTQGTTTLMVATFTLY